MISRLAWGALGVNAEGDSAVIDVVGKRIGYHGNNHDDVLAGLLHREEGDDVVRQALPAQALQQYPAHAQLQGQAQEEAADKEHELTLEIVLGLEDPIAVPQETVDDTKDVADHIGDTIGKFQLSVQDIEDDKRDQCVQHTDHSILEQLYARLTGFGFIDLHDNSFLAWQN